MDRLINDLITWAKANEYELKIPIKNDDEVIDFININTKSKSISFGSFDVN